MSRLNMAAVFFKGKSGSTVQSVRADQAALLGGEGHEDDASAFALLHGGEAAGELHDGGGARAIVIGAVMDLPLAALPARLPKPP